MNVMPISPTVCGAASSTRPGLMLEYQKSPDPGTAHRATLGPRANGEKHLSF